MAEAPECTRSTARTGGSDTTPNHFVPTRGSSSVARVPTAVFTSAANRSLLSTRPSTSSQGSLSICGGPTTSCSAGTSTAWTAVQRPIWRTGSHTSAPSRGARPWRTGSGTPMIRCEWCSCATCGSPASMPPHCTRCTSTSRCAATG